MSSFINRCAMLGNRLAHVLDRTNRRKLNFLLAAVALIGAMFVGGAPQATGATCANPVACENLLPGTPASQWNVDPSRGATITGFSSPFSVNIGQTVQFKIESPASSYAVDIYRMGYYGGDGARLEASVTPNIVGIPESASLRTPTRRPAWSTAATGASPRAGPSPSTAVSGVYFAHIYRTDGTSDENHDSRCCAVMTPVIRTSSSRRPMKPGRLTTPGAATAFTRGTATDTLNRSTSLDPGPCGAGQLRPAVQHSLQRRLGRTTSSTPSSR